MTDEDLQAFITLLYRNRFVGPFNTFVILPEYFSPGDVTNSLSGLRFNSSGWIVGAKAVMHIWLLADTSKSGGMEEAMDWELGFIDLLVDSPPPGKPGDLQIYGLAERSYDDEIKFVVRQGFT